MSTPLAARHRTRYVWPDTGMPSTLFIKVVDAVLSVSSFRGSIIDADIEMEMRKLVRDGGSDYLNFDLPKLYHGLVHRRCLEAVYSKTGAYFGGLSPDIFASLSIACVAKRVVVTDYPLTIPGACPGSGSADSQKGKCGGCLENTFLWRERGDYHWCELVPRVYTAATVWADSGVAALPQWGEMTSCNK